MTDTAPPMPETCELCGRGGLELTKHHLIPRARHNKSRTQRNHSKDEMKLAIAWLCRPCHSTVHAHLSEQELGEVYNDVPSLKQHPEISKFTAWVRKQPVDRKVAMKKPKR